MCMHVTLLKYNIYAYFAAWDTFVISREQGLNISCKTSNTEIWHECLVGL